MKLLALISSAYPNFEVTEERIEIWSEDMKDVPFEPALDKFTTYRRSNKWAPTIADIYEVATIHKKLELEDRTEWLRLHGDAEPMKQLGVGD